MSSANVFVIFVNNELKGYVQHEATAKKIIQELALTLKRDLVTDTTKVYQEVNDTSVNIYTQETGTYINGSVQLRHTVRYTAVNQLQQIIS